MLQFQTNYCTRNGLQFDNAGRRLMVVTGWPTLFDTLGGDEPRVLKPADGSFAPHATLVRGGSALAHIAARDICVWDCATGDELVIPDVGQDLTDLAASPDGATVYATNSAQDRSYNWHTQLFALDAASGAAKGSFPTAHGAYTWLSVSADGRRLVGRGSYDAAAWDLTDPTAPATVINVGGVGHYIDAVAPSADGTRLAIATSRGVQLWDIADAKPVQVFRSGKHKRRVSAAVCHPSRPLIVTGDAGGAVFVWDHAGRVLHRYDWGFVGEVNSLCFAPDGLRCAAAAQNGKVVVWDFDV